MISARRGAQLGLFAALSVMALSISILLIRGRDRYSNRNSSQPMARIEFSPIRDQVVSSGTIPR